MNKTKQKSFSNKIKFLHKSQSNKSIKCQGNEFKAKKKEEKTQFNYL